MKDGSDRREREEEQRTFEVPRLPPVEKMDCALFLFLRRIAGGALLVLKKFNLIGKLQTCPSVIAIAFTRRVITASADRVLA